MEVDKLTDQLATCLGTSCQAVVAAAVNILTSDNFTRTMDSNSEIALGAK